MPHSLRTSQAAGGSREVAGGTPTSPCRRTPGRREQGLWVRMPAQPLTSCDALGNALELLEPQLLHLFNGNDRLYVMKVHPGQLE